MLALLAMLFIGGSVAVYAQGEDSTDVTTDVPKDTISIDNSAPKFYDEPTAQEATQNNNLTYIIVGGIVVVAGAAFFFMKKKKK